MGCRIEIRIIGSKYRLLDLETNLFLTNNSGTAPLEYGSERAACRGHDKHCKHEVEVAQFVYGDVVLDRSIEWLGGSKSGDEWDEKQICVRCGDSGSVEDPLAEWYTLTNAHSLAHGQCGEDAGWRLA